MLVQHISSKINVEHYIYRMAVVLGPFYYFIYWEKCEG